MFLLILFLSCPKKEDYMVLPFRLLGGWGGGGRVRFTTLGCSGCHNVAHHLPIRGCHNVAHHLPTQIKTMVVPFMFLGGGAGVRVVCCCFGLLHCFFSYCSYHVPKNHITWFYLLGFWGVRGVGGGLGSRLLVVQGVTMLLIIYQSAGVTMLLIICQPR